MWETLTFCTGLGLLIGRDDALIEFFLGFKSMIVNLLEFKILLLFCFRQLLLQKMDFLAEQLHFELFILSLNVWFGYLVKRINAILNQ